MLYTALEIVLVFVAVALIVLILLQQGKGADAGAAFGSGASGTVFGAGGSANFLSRATAVLATLFFILALAMTYLSHHISSAPQSIVERALKQAKTGALPAAPLPTAGQAPPLSTTNPSRHAPPTKPRGD